MRSPFFITGLPQSRTTWLANLFCTGGVFCHHDLLGMVESVDDYLTRLRRDALDGRVGDSDSGLLSCYRAVRRSFPASPWVLVTRDFDEAWESLVEFVAEGPWDKQLNCSNDLRAGMQTAWEAARQELMQWRNVLTVPYAALEEAATLRQVWEHCVPGVRFDIRRAEMLQTLSVRPFQAKSPMRVHPSLVKDLWQSGAQSSQQ